MKISIKTKDRESLSKMTFNFAIIFSLSSIGLSSGLAYGEVSTNPYRALEVLRDEGANATGRLIMDRVTQISNLDDLSREQKGLVRGLLGEYERLQKAQRNDGLAYLNAAIAASRDQSYAEMDPYDRETLNRILSLENEYNEGNLKTYKLHATGTPILTEADRTDLNDKIDQLIEVRAREREETRLLRESERAQKLKVERMTIANFENEQLRLLAEEKKRVSEPVNSTIAILAKLNNEGAYGRYDTAELNYVFDLETISDKAMTRTEKETMLSRIHDFRLDHRITDTLRLLIPSGQNIHLWHRLSNDNALQKESVSELISKFNLYPVNIPYDKFANRSTMGLDSERPVVHYHAFSIMVAKQEAKALSQNVLVQRILALEVAKVLKRIGSEQPTVEIARSLNNLSDLRPTSLAWVVSILRDSANSQTKIGAILTKIGERNKAKEQSPATETKAMTGGRVTSDSGNTSLTSLSCKILLGAK